jgi:hypothetical protein
MVTSNKYRTKADECFKAAHSLDDAQCKLTQLNLAQRWLRLAAELDMIDAETSSDAA